MRPINVTLCSTTWELAKEKNNFSAWVRRKLIEDRKPLDKWYEYECNVCSHVSKYQASRVLGVRLTQDCHECGGTATLNGGDPQ
jgi:hypothetical protein